VLEESNGALWWIADPMAAESYQSIASVDALLAGTTTASAGEAAIWPWALGGVAVAGGIALAAGGGGGGGGGGSDSDNGSGNGSGSDGGNGNGSNPTLPGTDPNDTTPPGAATNLRFSADGTQLSGSAEANSIITVTDANGNVIGRGQTNGNGEFTVDLGKPYTNGETLTATPTDGAGNTGPGTTVTAADTTPPQAPTLNSVTDDVGSVTGSLTSGQSTDDARPLAAAANRVAPSRFTTRVPPSAPRKSTATAAGPSPRPPRWVKGHTRSPPGPPTPRAIPDRPHRHSALPWIPLPRMPLPA